MEGYSVTEAASVLGVPTERVWELLARGILSGAPDGETGMRVFLQPRPAPAPPAIEEPRRPNGGAREPEVEASPFRELLTEFRNLTERYGQALLALGEARGEVASLRSRVDLLEARFDLRLPMSGPVPAQAPAASGWASPQPLPPTEPEAPAPTAEAVEEEVPQAVEAPPRRKRGRGHRRATDDFAEALARAEDPSPAELPGAAEAAAAFAALREEAATVEPEAEPAGADFGLPRELPAAESMVVEPEREPEPGAGAGTDTTLEAEEEPAQAAVAADAEPEPEPALEMAVEPEPAPEDIDKVPPAEPELEPTPEPRPEREPEIVAEKGLEVEPAVEGEPKLIPAAMPEGVAFEPEAPAPAPEPVGEGSWDRERYSARIEEPDWIPEERDPVEPAGSTTDHGEVIGAEPPEAATIEPELASQDEAVPPAATRRADEETVLWFERDLGLAPPWPEEDDPAAEIEVASTGTRTTPSPEPTSVPEPAPESPPATDTSAVTAGVPPTPSVQALVPPNTASRAYRRLRRIFPG